jgi:glutaredoxin-related protein
MEQKKSTPLFTECCPELIQKLLTVQQTASFKKSAKPTYINNANCMTEEQVRQAELKWDIAFPSDYRRFLIEGGPSGEEEGLLRWDGTQDQLIQALYDRVFSSLCAAIRWGCWKEIEWGTRPTGEGVDGALSEEQIQSIAKAQMAKARKLIPVTFRHFTLSAKHHTEEGKEDEEERKERRLKKLTKLEKKIEELTKARAEAEAITNDKKQTKNAKSKARETLSSILRELRPLEDKAAYYRVPREGPSTSDAVMSFALSQDQFDIQDVMMQGGNFAKFLQYRMLDSPFEQVNSDAEYNALKKEWLWGLFVN